MGSMFYYHLQVWRYKGANTQFLVRSGEAFSRINYRLYKKGLISSATIFYRYAKYTSLLNKFKAGRYLIKHNSSMADVADILLKGKSIIYKVTIPEGKNLYEIAKILAREKVTSSTEFIRLAKDSEFAKKFNINAATLEGYLYPDSYYFGKDVNAKRVIETMIRTFWRKVQPLDFTQSKLSFHEVIILASIVEKETGAAHERPLIAGVFANRLKKKMRLQSDPTTIYGIYENFNGNLRKKHLQKKTPYNTYRINGLPIGPISNPGVSSIKAVLNPAEHKAIYFVSKNNGTHVFTSTYREHLKAVRKYQKSRRYRSGRSWRNLKKKRVN